MKKNRTMKAAAVLLALTLMTSCFVGGTFAKYTSEFKATDSARVAKWAFRVDDTGVDLVTAKSFDFNLFKTVMDDDLANAETAVDTTKKIIAPGTGGTVTVALTNDSEVAAKITVAYEADEKNVPLQWSFDGTVGSWVDNIADLNTKIVDKEIKWGASTNISLHWKWAYENDGVAVGQDDAKDTNLGINGTIEPTVTVTVTATQLDTYNP